MLGATTSIDVTGVYQPNIYILITGNYRDPTTTLNNAKVKLQTLLRVTDCYLVLYMIAQ